MNIAFIGLGIMGSRMARNLLKDKSLSLTVANRSAEAVKALEAEGARGASSASEAARNADIVITMLSDPTVLEDVAFGDEGFVAAMQKGALWVNSSTVDPACTRQCANRANAAGVRFLDAPVAGTKQPAEDGTLTYLLGGDATDVEGARPLLELMGQKILHVGAAGQGSAFKMLVNALLAQSMLAYAETALLGEKFGFSRDFLMDTLPNLPVSAPFLQGKSELIREGNYEAQFPLELMHKDLHLLEQTAYEQNQPMYLANLAKTVFGSAKQAGRGREDFAAVFDFLNGNR